MRTIIVATRGASTVPEFAGATWIPLQYVLGLQQLGFRVVWVDHHKGRVDRRQSRRRLPYFMRRFGQLATEFGFADSFHVANARGHRLVGMADEELAAVCDSAELMISISEIPPVSSPLQRVRPRAYIDIDPGFTQLWARQLGLPYDDFDLLFTTGLNVGGDACSIPTDGRTWHTLVPPVAMDWWPPDIDGTCASFTTITDWHAGQTATDGSEDYGGKRSEFLKLIDLPGRIAQDITLAVAMEGEYADAVLMTEHGWNLVDSYRFTGDVHAYQEFIRHSRAEFSVAKEGYVRSRGGWISDRTAVYLATGKPALVQSTFLEEHLPTGTGLLTFRDMDEAVAGIEAINADYLEHCAAARKLAEEYFAASVVLPRLLALAGVATPQRVDSPR